MTTISVPLNSKQTDYLDALVADFGSNRASVMRKALERLAEEEAINAVLQAQQEYKDGKGLTGDLDALLAKID